MSFINEDALTGAGYGVFGVRRSFCSQICTCIFVSMPGSWARRVVPQGLSSAAQPLPGDTRLNHLSDVGTVD
ncbi:hypothetical protein J8273_5643 [Carpediemonas membranifera]|uniref:Uncharacterized protein n=1 Tax=Carpediemonas membranifera TaxID=201153 RepID=A0A8J6ASI0_9EUKA|nr:hypothetical protein J8273_5643 [Carpediemonas membranifera]|eukprot:KAG9392938.1 hypothetical protein J8273_5643 [Carpediemonas membranifera]